MRGGRTTTQARAERARAKGTMAERAGVEGARAMRVARTKRGPGTRGGQCQEGVKAKSWPRKGPVPVSQRGEVPRGGQGQEGGQC